MATRKTTNGGNKKTTSNRSKSTTKRKTSTTRHNTANSTILRQPKTSDSTAYKARELSPA